MTTKDYYTQFYETEDICPYTCGVNATICHGIIYTYRKSWIRRRIKKKIIFQVSKSCRDFWSEDSLEQTRSEVKLRIEEALKFLNEP